MKDKIILIDTIEDENLHRKLKPYNIEKYSAKLPFYGPYTIDIRNNKKFIIANWRKDFDREPYYGEYILAYEEAPEINVFNMGNVWKDLIKISNQNNDEQLILDFCNKYGVLGGEPDEEFPVGHKNTIEEQKLSGSIESLDYFMKQIFSIQKCIDSHRMQGNKQNFIYTSNSQMWIDGLRATVTRYMENGLRWVIPSIVYDNKNEGFIMVYKTYTLLGAIYYLLWEMMRDKIYFRQCKYCGSDFVPTKHNAEFCPPRKEKDSKYDEKQSLCSINYFGFKRWAIKQIKDGKTIEEITKVKWHGMISRTIEEVEEWFKI
jgi:hypothetical protein